MKKIHLLLQTLHIKYINLGPAREHIGIYITIADEWGQPLLYTYSLYSREGFLLNLSSYDKESLLKRSVLKAPHPLSSV